jgi:Reverse transcriptase (RNA-dependent DNA polymerase)
VSSTELLDPVVRLTLVPHRNGVRWLTRLDERSARSYGASVVAVAPSIEAALGTEVVANRVAGTAAGAGAPSLRLEPWGPDRGRFLAAARHHATSAGAMLLADVRSCYPSIGPDVVARSLHGLGCSRDDVGDLLRVLESINRAGVHGLPIGPDASAVLANAVLADADRALSSTGVRHIRWVDDVWAFARTRRAGERALECLRGSLQAAGLVLAEEKTALLEDRLAIDAVVGRVRVSSVEVARSYHRPSDAHPLSGIADSHPVVSANGRVDPDRRAARATGRIR